MFISWSALFFCQEWTAARDVGTCPKTGKEDWLAVGTGWANPLLFGKFIIPRRKKQKGHQPGGKRVASSWVAPGIATFRPKKPASFPWEIILIVGIWAS